MREESRPWILVVVGFAVAVMPASLLELAAGDQWEVELIRFVGLLVSSLAFLRKWSIDQGGWTALRMRIWTGLSFSSALIYVFSARPFFLVALISILFGALASSGIERADLASQRLRESLKRS